MQHMAASGSQNLLGSSDDLKFGTAGSRVTNLAHTFREFDPTFDLDFVPSHKPEDTVCCAYEQPPSGILDLSTT